ncbi:hypothetical protein DFH28DRAFT_1027852 [Melampsora americana]|nr:hypothetical protein DFH28DRAFT_1027852 [Melampsora americana]
MCTSLMSESYPEVDEPGSQNSAVTSTPSSLEPFSEIFEVLSISPPTPTENLRFDHTQSANSTPSPALPFSILPPREPLRSLIGDVGIAKSRLVVTKTHCIYTENLLGYRSCLLGFQIVFHPCRPNARIKRSEITLSIFHGPKDLGSENPIIKAIYPSQGIVHTTGEPTTVHHSRETSFGLSLGVDAYGKVDLTHTRSRQQTTTSSSCLLGSGIETNTLLLTLKEDPEARTGVLPSLDFAVLVYLPSSKTQAFETRLTVKASPGGNIGAAVFGWYTDSKTWTSQYDGITELGRHTMKEYSDGSKSIFSVSENEMGFKALGIQA